MGLLCLFPLFWKTWEPPTKRDTSNTRLTSVSCWSIADNVPGLEASAFFLFFSYTAGYNKWWADKWTSVSEQIQIEMVAKVVGAFWQGVGEWFWSYLNWMGEEWIQGDGDLRFLKWAIYLPIAPWDLKWNYTFKKKKKKKTSKNQN